MKKTAKPETTVSNTKVTPNKKALRQAFESMAESRQLAARDIVIRLEQTLSTLVSAPTIKTRTKRFESYYKKYISILKSGNSTPKITDLMGR